MVDLWEEVGDLFGFFFLCSLMIGNSPKVLFIAVVQLKERRGEGGWGLRIYLAGAYLRGIMIIIHECKNRVGIKSIRGFMAFGSNPLVPSSGQRHDQPTLPTRDETRQGIRLSWD